jgi:hypothetical protein
MEANQPLQSSHSGNHGAGNGRYNGGGTACPTEKACYRSKQEAEKSAQEMQARHPHEAKQYAYPCDECPNWHLTSMQPDAFGMGKSRQQIAPESMLRNGNASKGGRPKGYRTRTEAEKLEAFKLQAQKMKIAVIAEKLGISYPTASNWLGDPALKAKYEASLVPKSLEDFQSEEQKLERQLADIRSKKAAAIEAKQFKFLPCWEGKGVLIKKEGNHVAFTLADAEELVIRLDDYLKQAEMPK